MLGHEGVIEIISSNIFISWKKKLKSVHVKTAGLTAILL